FGQAEGLSQGPYHQQLIGSGPDLILRAARLCTRTFCESRTRVNVEKHSEKYEEIIGFAPLGA
ncbi:MAG TPA: hypothetical protein PKM95_02895, partial [Deltaproteobacteria bacterium]|nr:hypothetical protein [Deltaproteobacteria bacterium]